jgi:hypothetical protein
MLEPDEFVSLSIAPEDAQVPPPAFTSNLPNYTEFPKASPEGYRPYSAGVNDTRWTNSQLRRGVKLRYEHQPGHQYKTTPIPPFKRPKSISINVNPKLTNTMSSEGTPNKYESVQHNEHITYTDQRVPRRTNKAATNNMLKPLMTNVFHRQSETQKTHPQYRFGEDIVGYDSAENRRTTNRYGAPPNATSLYSWYLTDNNGIRLTDKCLEKGKGSLVPPWCEVQDISNQGGEASLSKKSPKKVVRAATPGLNNEIFNMGVNIKGFMKNKGNFTPFDSRYTQGITEVIKGTTPGTGHTLYLRVNGTIRDIEYSHETDDVGRLNWMIVLEDYAGTENGYMGGKTVAQQSKIVKKHRELAMDLLFNNFNRKASASVDESIIGTRCPVLKSACDSEIYEYCTWDDAKGRCLEIDY